MAARCKDDKEWLANIPNKNMEQIIQSMKFNSNLKELLLGHSSPPMLRKSIDDAVGPIGK